jgi:hypothetical protein
MYVQRVDGPENTVDAREASMRLQLGGGSSAVTADEAAAGLAAAHRELADRGYSVGFGYVKNFGSPNGLDGIKLEYAITDGKRVANVHAIISGTRLAILGYGLGVDETDENVRTWALDELYQQAGSIARDDDRYATSLTRHPLRLG